jgi:2-C-methyl-D-erythritol 4-phosphate cytidylyltransferase/2-C-methyl-D-erythritol 2,4-cyclodiphosphate synthase
MHVTAIIAAGGSGRRLGSATPKQLLDLGGRTLLDHAVRTFRRHPLVSELIVVLPGDREWSPGDPADAPERPMQVVAGGARRQDSVGNGFDRVSPGADIVLIHDAARPFVSDSLIARTVEAAVEHGAAIAALQASDTVKRVRESAIEETIPRETIYLAQTPQAFRRDVLAAAVALGRSGVDATDEAMLAERAGYRVHIVEGDPANVKITTAADLEQARRRLGDGVPGSRAGTGYDLHRLVEGRPLVVGGVTLPFDRGALGHSDADVVCHAATDAILGAAGLGDIGRHFPDSDPQWKDASSLDLLGRAARMVAEQGYAVANIDVTVILERPKIQGAIAAMQRAVADAIGIDPSSVSIKGKTNEGVDAIGRGEAVAAHAVALLRRP